MCQRGEGRGDQFQPVQQSWPQGTGGKRLHTVLTFICTTTVFPGEWKWNVEFLDRTAKLLSNWISYGLPNNCCILCWYRLSRKWSNNLQVDNFHKVTFLSFYQRILSRILQYYHSTSNLCENRFVKFFNKMLKKKDFLKITY